MFPFRAATDGIRHGRKEVRVARLLIEPLAKHLSDGHLDQRYRLAPLEGVSCFPSCRGSLVSDAPLAVL